MTLEQFLVAEERSSYIEHPDFAALYVRKSTRFVHGEWVPTFDIARVYANKLGQGAFTRLVQWLQARTDRKIYVESVLETRFGTKLQSWGFEPMPYDSDSFILLGEFGKPAKIKVQ